MADQGSVYSANQVVGRTLFSKKAVLAYNHPDDRNSAFTIPKNSRVGTVDTYILRGNKLFWAINEGGFNNNGFYVLHETGTFDVDALREQGAMTTLETIQAKEQENQDFFDKLGDIFSDATDGVSNIFKTAKWVMPVVLVALALILIIYAYKTFAK